MFKNIYAVILFTALAAGTAIAQSGALKGKVIDEGNGEGISFANIQIEQNGAPVGKTVADIDGNFTIKPIPPGKYDLKAVAVGYAPLQISGIVIGSDKTTYQDMKVKTTMQEIKEFVKIEYVEPLIDPDTKSGGTVTREEFQAMPSKNINSVASTTAGVFQADEGQGLNVRGAREAGTDYYIDGEKVRGSAALPQSSIEQVSVITGGVPAQYGDATGGFINITTRGGMRTEYFGGVELISSQLTDAYDYNFAGLNAGGPLFSKKDTSGNKTAKVGFFISGEVSSDKDPSPSANGLYRVKEEKQRELEEHPLSSSEAGGTVVNAELLRWEDLEHIKARQNMAKKTANISGKLDFKASDKITLTVGGNVAYDNRHVFAYEYSLINPSHNLQNVNNTKRIYGKVTHRLGKERSKDDKTTALFQNAYYTLQVGYTKYKETQQDELHKEKLFNYGHIGKYETLRARKYALIANDKDTTIDSTYYNMVQWADTSVLFTAGDLNPFGANYTKDYIELYGNPTSISSVIGAGYYMVNGARPRSMYSIWYNTGRVNNQYYNIEQNQFRVTGQFSADMKNHALQAGFEYEKRDERQWNTAPIGMWTTGRQLVNKHLTQLNVNDSSLYSGPIVVGTTVINNPLYPVYNHEYMVTSGQQSQFDKSLRIALGKDADEWIDFDSYDPSTFDIGMFSADELLNGGSNLASWYGYSFKGEKMDKTDFDVLSVEKYFKGGVNGDKSDMDANGNLLRSVPSFQPVYVSGYIQDKFDIKDMKFNVGVRIDHFNANQPVLKDRFLLFEANTVSEVSTIGGNSVTHPSNVPNDAVVYVDDAANPNSVKGYRSGETWYNELGVVIPDPTSITPSGKVIQPYLKYPNEPFLGQSKVENLFTMYEAQNTFMPRIAFAFPISNMANFFAHYDVLTQRPPTNLRFDPRQYLFIQTVGGSINNPGLKPERTTDYEIGFTQVLSEKKNAALTLSAFYREMRDMIQQIVLYGAYPVNYTTFGNVDFGTVKGFTVGYDLRRTNNISMNASYTLQFAEGTGSAATSAGGMIGNNEPNLRTTMPLDFDQRHSIVLTTDYRFGRGSDYKGPSASWAKMILEDLGGNMVFRVGSGLPYTRQKNVTSGNGDNSSAVVFGINQRSSMKGQLNGSSLPWNYKMDLRVDKNIPLKWGKGEGDKKKVSNLQIYVTVMNVLNTKNVLNLYRFTGDADDDGYLSAPENQNGIENYMDPQSFRDLYTAKIMNPSHYSLPRRCRIGVVLDF